MDASLKLINLRKSLVKFFKDSLITIEGLSVVFDEWIPEFVETDTSNDAWVSINFARPNFGRVSTIDVVIFIRTRKDLEGWDNNRLYDKVMNYLVSSDSDRKVVTLYNTEVTPWVAIGGVSFYLRSGDMGEEEMDLTNISIINLQATWGAKL